MYRMLRVFCGTSWELEGERRSFYDIAGSFNEQKAMPRGILYVPVSLTNVRDKRPMQYVVEENIQDSFGYLLALSGDWGPTERHFERDFRLALECQRNPSLPMRHVALMLRRSPASPPGFLTDLEKLGVSPILFEDIAGFGRQAAGLFSSWLDSEAATSASAT
jgi:hypothetical protein